MSFSTCSCPACTTGESAALSLSTSSRSIPVDRRERRRRRSTG